MTFESIYLLMYYYVLLDSVNQSDILGDGFGYVYFQPLLGDDWTL